MQKLLVAGVALTALIGTQALAADMALKGIEWMVAPQCGDPFQWGHALEYGDDSTGAAVWSLLGGGFNRSTQHPSLLIWHVGRVCIWRDMHGHGSRGSRRQSSGGAESAANRRVRVTRAL